MSITLVQNHTPPGPAALPLLGGREALAQFFRDPIAFLTRLHREYGQIVAFTRHHPTWLAVCGAAANQQLLTHHELFTRRSSPLHAASGHDAPAADRLSNDG